MNIATIPLQRLHKFHLEIIEELKLREQHTSQLNIQVERQQDFLQQKLNQAIQEKDQAFQ